MNNDPLHRYDGHTAGFPMQEVDQRILSYDSLESRRYQSLRMKQPIPRGVTRVFQERCKTGLPSTPRSTRHALVLFPVGSAVSPRAQPARTVRAHTAPGYRLLVDRIPNQDQTMVSQRFNKMSPFVTEFGNNPNVNPSLRDASANAKHF